MFRRRRPYARMYLLYPEAAAVADGSMLRQCSMWLTRRCYEGRWTPRWKPDDPLTDLWSREQCHQVSQADVEIVPTLEATAGEVMKGLWEEPLPTMQRFYGGCIALAYSFAVAALGPDATADPQPGPTIARLLEITSYWGSPLPNALLESGPYDVASAWQWIDRHAGDAVSEIVASGYHDQVQRWCDALGLGDLRHVDVPGQPERDVANELAGWGGMVACERFGVAAA